MIFYRLGLQRVIEYLHLENIFKDEYREKLLHKKANKKVYKTILKTDRNMNLYVSVLLSVINLLVCLTIPYAVLESPCEELKKNDLDTLYIVAKWFERYLAMTDRLIIVLIVFLIVIWTKTIWDGIKRTNLKISPWIERGKYVLPKKQ